MYVKFLISNKIDTATLRYIHVDVVDGINE